MRCPSGRLSARDGVLINLIHNRRFFILSIYQQNCPTHRVLTADGGL